MSRKDDILKSFLENDLLKSKYNIETSELPSNIRDALKSPIAIISAIALIVESLESTEVVTDKSLRELILQHLNQVAI